VSSSPLCKAALLSLWVVSSCSAATKRSREIAPHIDAPLSAPPRPELAAVTPPPACADDDLMSCTQGCNDERWEDCATLGSLYLTGSAVEKDEAHAMSLFRLACDGRSARGCMRLGDAHHAGLVDDPIEEAHLYQLACEHGANAGCLAAGLAYLEGRGVLMLPRRAAELFEPACQRGNATACYELARLLLSGDGVARNPELARQLLNKACQLGAGPACIVEEQLVARANQLVDPRSDDDADPPEVPELPEGTDEAELDLD